MGCGLRQVRFHEDGLLTTIGRQAFCECASLTEASIPSTVEVIKSMAFQWCGLLARVSLQEGLKIIEMGAFLDCGFETVAIPRSLEVLGGIAFHLCCLLQEVKFEECNLSVIGKHAFMECFQLHTISFPSTVERLESGTFKLCHSLRVIKFQNGLKYVADETFYSCKNLQSVALPESVELIGLNAFAKCPKLVSVEFRDASRAVTIHNDAFAECVSLTNICLPSESRLSAGRPDDHGERINSFRGCTALEDQYGDTNTSLALMHRFDDLPIHKKCYHASVTTADELAREIESSVQSSQDSTLDHLVVDPFGMTPFHVLLSAANCRLDLLQILLDAYPPHVLGWKDVNGKTAIEYCWQQSCNLTEDFRPILQAALERWMVDSISSWKGLEAWKSDMSSRVNAIVAEDEVEQRQTLLQEAIATLLRYERVEATTLVELSLWKMEKKAGNPSVDVALLRTAVNQENRKAYSIRSGSSVVIPNVIPFYYEANLTSAMN